MKTQFSIFSSPCIHLFTIILLLAALYACQKEKAPQEEFGMAPIRAAASVDRMDTPDKREILVATHSKKSHVHFRTHKCAKTNINIILNNYK